MVKTKNKGLRKGKTPGNKFEELRQSTTEQVKTGKSIVNFMFVLLNTQREEADIF